MLRTVRGRTCLSVYDKTQINGFINTHDRKFTAETVIDHLKFVRHLRWRVPTTKQVSYYLSRSPFLRKCGHCRGGVIYERREDTIND